ncbi:unnamed protein product [Penicillium salamii]|uniref:Enoyl-CoA hydratase n=1 Tax=Penicillium salamii TaxID=1612424 RepID=A0A9W4NYU3_9EURO|nr:unnamed protein product [Penicillium salamii]CAG8246322.1 unnamed protein product [Penicillium salamii]CAG8290802.1 unnamed protein product [Penicillium salamii]CAG8320620.1 unnamed protein product [Penicillium salamii]CAG8401167.1 unnamed protein product [Penicillium salamii]
MTEPTQVTIDTSLEGISVITINRPERKNAVDTLTAEALYQAILNFEDDPKQKVCVLTGAGGTFCAGADLHGVAQANHDKPAANLQPVNGRNLGPMGPSRMMVKKPVICAICAWLRKMPSLVSSADGGTVRLQAIVGLGRALDMTLTGRAIGVQEALAMGLASRVVSKGESLKEAIALAKQLIAFPDLCLNTDRQSCYYSAYNASSFQDAMVQEFNAGEKVISKEAIAGAARFSKGLGRHGNFQDHSKL